MGESDRVVEEDSREHDGVESWVRRRSAVVVKSLFDCSSPNWTDWMVAWRMLEVDGRVERVVGVWGAVSC